MTKAFTPVCLTLAAAWAAAAMPAPATAQGAAVSLASHRAVYELKLAQTRGKRSMNAVRGRILYDFSGSACEGYALQFRQVSELDSGEGNAVTSDLRATSWEDGAAKRLRFHSQNFTNQNLRDSVDGQAERKDGGIDVRLTEPEQKTFDLNIDVAFPSEHVRRIIEAAKAGKTLLSLPVYDGSEKGEKVYDTLAVIGQPIKPDGPKPDDAAGQQDALSHMVRWPATISYFDRSTTTGEQTPVYSITFELYENGISRALMLDYNDFVLSGTMTSIELRDTKPCP